MSGRPPKNCREAFTKIGDQLYPAPNYRYYSCAAKRAQLLQTDVENMIEHIDDDIRQLEQKRETVTATLRAHCDEQKLHQQNLKTEDAKLLRLRQEAAKLHRQISELKNIEDPDPVDVTTLEDEILVMKKQLEEYQRKKETVHREMLERKTTVETIEKELLEVEEKIDSIISSKLDPLKCNAQQAELEKNNMAQKLKHYENLTKEKQKLIQKEETDLATSEKDVNELRAKALKISERINTRKTAKQLDKEIDQCTQNLRNQEKTHGSHEEILVSYRKSKTKYVQITRDIGVLQDFLDQLKQVMGERHKAYETFRINMATRVHCMFTMLLSGKYFKGKIEFDHLRKHLNIHVQPTSEATEGNKDLKSLSGGERSYSTVCFILSLWEAMDSPFRILDEFDVFMDMVTRRLSMDLMLSTAKSKVNNQFLFLTPQNMSQLSIIEDSSKVKIFKMSDPLRIEHLSQPNTTWVSGTYHTESEMEDA